MIDVLGPESTRRRTTQEKIWLLFSRFEPGMARSPCCQQHGWQPASYFSGASNTGSLTAVCRRAGRSTASGLLPP